jgi:hypothetical protein
MTVVFSRKSNVFMNVCNGIMPSELLWILSMVFHGEGSSSSLPFV